MSLTTIGLIGLGVLIITLFSGIPVGFAMILVGFAGVWYVNSFNVAVNFVTTDLFTTFSSYGFSVAPMFVFMGSLIFYSGASGRLFNTAYKFFGRMPGGLAIATVAACTIFAAVSGSCNTSAAAMGKAALPEMKRFGYAPTLASGAIAAGGALGPIIPPSVVMILYGILTGESIGKLFIAGIIPGLLLCIIFIVMIYIMCRINPNLGPAGNATTWKEKVKSLSGTVEIIILFALVIGGLFVGLFTPTEAGAIGALGALIISLARRSISWDGFKKSLGDTASLTCMLFVILAGAVIFGHFMARTQIPIAAANWLISIPAPAPVILIIIIIMFAIGGCFIDAIALILLTLPILFPVVVQLGFDPIWFGLIIVLVTDIGLMTPPVGVTAYIISEVGNIPLNTVFKGITPFLIVLIVVSIVLIFVPEVVTFLPNLMS